MPLLALYLIRFAFFSSFPCNPEEIYCSHGIFLCVLQFLCFNVSTIIVFAFDVVLIFSFSVHFLSHFHRHFYELTSHLGGKALSCSAKA